MATTTNTKLTRLLLTSGIVAGPIYILVGAIEILTRPGFDMTRHDLSIMANGDWGWVHILMLILTGLLTVLGAIGLHRALREGHGRLKAPLMLGLYGLGLVAAGIFTADPALGFPIGTPADARAVSWHGLLHLISGSVGFVGLISACYILGNRFKKTGEQAWATFSRVTGTVFFAAFVGIAMGSNGSGALLTTVVLAFTAAVILAWTWTTMVLAKVKSTLD